ncbi:unnamed protein product [Brassica napus]|uniref:(rape) hypothetical protein n=1 Tax=Brassica napus TaxID=3708 RepID=A0A816RA96_BRANA|nr:unnamed protein product [Brassica napus]
MSSRYSCCCCYESFIDGIGRIAKCDSKLGVKPKTIP